MAELIALCARICSGKTTWARTICKERSAVLLSADEYMLRLFPEHLGDRHEEVSARVRELLLEQAAGIVRAGADVVLDWGFWHKADREGLRAFCRKEQIDCQIWYLEIDEELWRRRVERRNRAAAAGETRAYFVDEGLAAKALAAFEPPQAGEVDAVFRAAEDGPFARNRPSP